MLSRNEKGKLSLDGLDLEIFLGDLFSECKNKHEITWLEEQITGCTEGIAEERLEEIFVENNDNKENLNTRIEFGVLPGGEK